MLVTILFGRRCEVPAVRQFFRLKDDDRPTEEKSVVPPSTVRELLNESQVLGDALAAIVDPSLPLLPDDAPIVRPLPDRIRKPQFVCPYCHQSLSTRKRLRRHLATNAGTCQLTKGPRYQRVYQILLNDTLAQATQRCAGTDAAKLSEPLSTTGGALRNLEANGVRIDDALVASSVPPNLLPWSAEEKEKLFNGLQKFSRWRPDLIADYVGSKSTAETVAYLALLHQKALSVSDLHHHQEKKHSTTSFQTLPSNSSHSIMPREKLPAAREMSERWLELEEDLAEDAIAWETFTEEASRTPSSLRNVAQTAAILPLDAVGCTRCTRGLCDGVWPVCGACEAAGAECSWRNGFHPDAIPEEASR